MSRRRSDHRTDRERASDAQWRTLRVLCSGRGTHGEEIMARLLVHEDDVRGMERDTVPHLTQGEVEAMVTVDGREVAAPVVRRESAVADAAQEVADLLERWGAAEGDLVAESRAVREVSQRRRQGGPLHQTQTFRCTRCGRNVAMREEKFARRALALIVAGARQIDVSRLDRVRLT